MSQQFTRYHGMEGSGDRVSPSVNNKTASQGSNRFRGRTGSGDSSGFNSKYSDYSSNNTPPTSPSSATQTNNLIDYVIETLCFGESAFSFDMNFKALGANQVATQLAHDAEQHSRVDKVFGPKRHVRQEIFGITSGDAAAAAAAPQRDAANLSGSQGSRPGGTAAAPAAAAAPANSFMNGFSDDGNQALRVAIEKLNSRKEPHERTTDAIQKLSDTVLLEEKRVLKQGLRSFDVLFEKVTGRLPEKADKEPLRTVYAYYKELKKEIGVRGATQPNLAFQAAMEDREDGVEGKANTTSASSPLFGRHGSGGQGNFARMPAATTSSHTPPQPQGGSYHGIPGQKPTHNGAGGLASPNNGQNRSAMYLAPEHAPAQMQQQQPSAAPKQPPAPTAPTNLPPSEIDKLRAEKKVIKRKLFDFMSRFKEIHGRDVKTKEDRAPFAAEYDRYRYLKQVLQAHDNTSGD